MPNTNIDENIFKNDAKTIVDMAFNNKFFKDDITRDDMNGFEQLIHFLLKSKFETYVRVEELMNRLEKNKTNG